MADTKHLMAFRRERLAAGESIAMSCRGYVHDASAFEGELILTDRRLCFFRKGLLGERIESYPIGSISAIEAKSMLGINKLKVFTSHDSMEFHVIGGKAVLTALHQTLEDSRVGRPPVAAPAPDAQPSSAALSDHPLETLKKLGELREAGVLTDLEFETKKAELLSRL